MTQAIVRLGEYEDRVLQIVKGKFGLKNKSDAVNFVIKQYDQELLEPELRPEFIEDMKKIEKEKKIRIGTMKDFDKHFGIK
ncbi:MAG: DUF2683 family protein [archaeon]